MRGDISNVQSNVMNKIRFVGVIYVGTRGNTIQNTQWMIYVFLFSAVHNHIVLHDSNGHEHINDKHFRSSQAREPLRHDTRVMDDKW